MLENLKEIYDEEVKTSFQEIEFGSKTINATYTETNNDSKVTDNRNNASNNKESSKTERSETKNKLLAKTEKAHLLNKETNSSSKDQISVAEVKYN
jgi:hypothetical protein